MFLEFLGSTMNFQPKILPFDLKTHANSYVFDEGKFRAVENSMSEKILGYDYKAPSEPEGYGHFLLNHLNRTSKYLKEFMLMKGYDNHTADIISRSFRLHDAGKILQDISVWEHTAEKPGAEKKKIRAQHTQLGKTVLFDTIEELGLVLNDDDWRHIETIVYLMETHHERVNKAGPLGYAGDEMDEILQMGTILDEIDGKIKLDHQSLDAIFNDIRTRHKDKFDPHLVEDCYKYCIKYGRYADLSALQVPAHTL